MRDTSGSGSVAGLVIVLFVLAGCSGPGADPSDRSTFEVPQTATVDTGDADPLPYGVNESGVTSSFGLLQSHVGLLRLESFRVVRERTVTNQNLTVLDATRVDARVDRDRLRYLVEVDHGPSDGSRQAVYASAETTGESGRTQGSVVAVSLADGEVRSATRLTPLFGGAVPPRQVLSDAPTYRDRLYRYLAAVETARVERVDAAGDATRVRITATETTNEDRVTPTTGTVSNLSVGVTVTGQGRVTEAVASYGLTRDGTTVSVTERITFSAVGTVSVSPPDWYDRVDGEVTTTRTPDPGLIDVGNRTAG